MAKPRSNRKPKAEPDSFIYPYKHTCCNVYVNGVPNAHADDPCAGCYADAVRLRTRARRVRPVRYADPSAVPIYYPATYTYPNSDPVRVAPGSGRAQPVPEPDPGRVWDPHPYAALRYGYPRNW